MVCEELEFLMEKAKNVIYSPKKRRYAVIIDKDDGLLDEIRKKFGARVSGYKEAFRGRNYLVYIDGSECDLIERLVELGVSNITVATKKRKIAVTVPSEEIIEKLKEEFNVISVKEALKGVNWSVSIAL